MDVDPSKIKPIPLSTTLLLVNQFITQTTVFLNSFSEAMEKKISKVSSRVTELEILMSVFEADQVITSGTENLKHVEIRQLPTGEYNMHMLKFPASRLMFHSAHTCASWRSSSYTNILPDERDG